MLTKAQVKNKIRRENNGRFDKTCDSINNNCCSEKKEEKERKNPPIEK